jgi:hypothetical protein
MVMRRPLGEILDRAVQQRRLRIVRHLLQRLVGLPVLLIRQMDLDRAVAGLGDFRLGEVRDRDVDRARAGWKR